MPCPNPSLAPLLPTLSWCYPPSLLSPLPSCGISCELYQLVLKFFHLRNVPIIDGLQCLKTLLWHTVSHADTHSEHVN